MSDEISKEKHSKRRHKDTAASTRQIKIAKAFGFPTDASKPNRFAKMHSTNCGNPNCVSCMNPRKAWGDATMQEKKFFQDKLHVIEDVADQDDYDIGVEDHDYDERK